MECLSYVDLSHDYSKSIILTICHHITNTYICAIPPLNICHLCQICMKPNLRPAGPISPSPLLPLLWEFTSDGVIIPRSPLFPHPPIFVDDVELDHLLPLLVLVQLLHLPPLCPLLPAIPIWNKNFKSPNNLKLDQVMFIKRDSPHVLASFLLRNSDDVWFERPPLPPRPTL